MEAKIRESVERVRSLGVRIATHRFGVRHRGYWEASDTGEDKCCCPLGAVLLCSKATLSVVHGPAVQEALGVNEDWVSGFLLAFDGTTREWQSKLGNDANAGFELGVQLRQEFLSKSANKENKHAW